MDYCKQCSTRLSEHSKERFQIYCSEVCLSVHASAIETIARREENRPKKARKPHWQRKAERAARKAKRRFDITKLIRTQNPNEKFVVPKYGVILKVSNRMQFPK